MGDFPKRGNVVVKKVNCLKFIHSYYGLSSLLSLSLFLVLSLSLSLLLLLIFNITFAVDIVIYAIIINVLTVFLLLIWLL